MVSKFGWMAVLAATVVIVGGGLGYVVLTHPAPQVNNFYSNNSTFKSSGSGTNNNCTVYGAQTLVATVSWYNQSQNPPKPAPVASQTVSAYLPGAAIATGTATTSAAGIASVTGLNSCTTYNITMGDNSHYFLTWMRNVNLGTSTNPQIMLTALNYSAPTIYATNGTGGTTFTTPFTTIHKVTAGSSIGSAGFSIKAGTNYDSQGPGIVAMYFNGSDIQAPFMSGEVSAMAALSGVSASYSPTYITSNSANTRWSNLGSQSSYTAFYMNPSWNNQYSTLYTGSASQPVNNQGSATYNPTINVKGTFVNNEIISIAWIPVTTFYNTATNPATGKAYGPQTGVALNPFTGTPIFTQTLDANAIQLTPT